MIARIRHLLTVLRRSLNRGRVVQATIRGVRYELDLSEMIDQALYEVGVYEEATTRLLERVLEPHMVVLEVGANIGAHTFDMARVLETGGGLTHARRQLVALDGRAR